MTHQLNSQERKILENHIRYEFRRPTRRDWTVYLDLERRGLLTISEVAWTKGKFMVSTSPAGREALRLVGLAA